MCCVIREFHLHPGPEHHLTPPLLSSPHSTVNILTLQQHREMSSDLREGGRGEEAPHWTVQGSPVHHITSHHCRYEEDIVVT